MTVGTKSTYSYEFVFLPKLFDFSMNVGFLHIKIRCGLAMTGLTDEKSAYFLIWYILYPVDLHQPPFCFFWLPSSPARKNTVVIKRPVHVLCSGLCPSFACRMIPAVILVSFRFSALFELLPRRAPAVRCLLKCSRTADCPHWPYLPDRSLRADLCP